MKMDTKKSTKKIQIAAPQEAIDGMKKLLDDVSEKYNT